MIVIMKKYHPPLGSNGVNIKQWKYKYKTRRTFKTTTN